MPLWDKYDRNLPHCIAYEFNAGDTSRALQVFMSVLEKTRIANRWDVLDVEPHKMLTVPALFQALSTTWTAQLDEYGQEGTAQSLIGHATTQQVWQHYQWVQHGRRIYDLGENLARALLDTEMRVAAIDVPVPIPSYYVRVPRSLGLTVSHKHTGEHVLDGFYVTHALKDVPRRPTGSISIIAVGIPHDTAEKVGDDALACYGVPGDVKNIEQSLLSEELRAAASTGLGENVNRVAIWARLVVGLALYLTSEGVDLDKRRLGPSDALRAQARKIGGHKGKRMIEEATLPVHYVRVGFREKLDANLAAHSRADDETRALTKRFVVRGHYRNQAHGPEHKQRKLIYIRPHWKGPTWAEVTSARVHKVE